MNHQRLANRRMTEIPSFSIELYLKGKTKEVSTHPQTPPLTKRSPDENSDSYLERIQHKLRDRRRSTPAISFSAKPVIKHCPTLSESFNRLALGSLNDSSGDLDLTNGIAIRSGHKEIERIFSSEEDNESERKSFQLNQLNCPNLSTVQCGCGLINCPCCNLMMNLEMTEIGDDY